jgi:hypothetical protein
MSTSAPPSARADSNVLGWSAVPPAAGPQAAEPEYVYWYQQNAKDRRPSVWALEQVGGPRLWIVVFVVAQPLAGKLVAFPEGGCQCVGSSGRVSGSGSW